MKKLLSLLFVLGLTFSACGTSQTQSAPPVQTSTPSLVPTRTQTPIPPTSTITPLPTIPTFTPTFDASTIVTVTPAEKAECPVVSQTHPKPISLGSYPSGQKYIDSPEPILDYLNQGGKLEELGKELSGANQYLRQLRWRRANINSMNTA